MKKLIIHNIQADFLFTRDRVNHLVVENPKELRKIISMIRNQLENGDEYLSLFDEKGELNVLKAVTLIDNPLNIQIDEKKLSTFIQKDISLNINVEKQEQFLILWNQITNYIDSITYDYPIALTYDNELSLQSFLKAISLSSSYEYDSFLTYLIGQIKKLHQMTKCSLMIFYNLTDLLTIEERNLFHKEMQSNEIDYLLLSSHEPKEKLDEEFLVIIDSDLAELHIEPKNQKD